MQKINAEVYGAVSKRNKEGVASKLKAFLLVEIPKLKSGEIIEITSKDFLNSEDFHYYTPWKMLNADFKGVVEAKFPLKEHARAEKVYIKKL